MDDHREHEALSIHPQVPLLALDLHSPGIAPFPSYARRLDTLAVNAAGTRLRIPSQRHPEAWA
jgi:hypothetical protein